MLKKASLLLLILLLCQACENTKKEMAEIEAQAKEAIEKMEDVDMLYSEDALVKVRLQAPLLLQHKTESPYVEFPQGVQVTFFDEEKKISGELSAKYGVRYIKDQKTMVRDSVIWRSLTENKQLETEELNWNERTRYIYSNKFVKLTTDTEVIIGTGFESTQDFKKAKILNTTGIFTIKDNDLP